MQASQPQSRHAVLLFTDIVGSTALKSRIGTPAYATMLMRHNALFTSACSGMAGAEVLKHTGDGFFAAFPTASDAVRAALLFQGQMRAEPWAHPIATRIGIHAGEVAIVQMQGQSDVVGVVADLASRVMSLAGAGQILLTRSAFNDARQFVSEAPAIDGQPAAPLNWVAHGAYLFDGIDEPVDVFEVSTAGSAPPSVALSGGGKARRVVPHDQEQTLGWRPAIGLDIPARPGWALERKLGEGGFGEVWLGGHAGTHQHRVFKFCFDAERLRSFKREITLFRLLRDALGDRPDIARLYEVKLDEPPFFLESEWAEGGNLSEWSTARGGIATVPLETRIDMVAKIADAVAAAHSVGILHKDIKPANLLVSVEPDQSVRLRLSDFGIGMLADRSQIDARHITAAGFTSITEGPSTYAGTRIYTPPEQLAGKPFTTLGDVYALGVLLYQMAVGDLERPLAVGWEREISDELLREDIAASVEGDPAQRLASAADLARRLRQRPQRQREREAAQLEAEASRRRHHRFRLAAAAALMLLLMAFVALVGFLREGGLRRRAEHAEVEQRDARNLADQHLAESLLRFRLNQILLARSAAQQPDFPKAWEWLAGVEPSPLTDEDWSFAAWECRRRSREIYARALRPSLPSGLGWYSARSEAAVSFDPVRNRIIIQRRRPTSQATGSPPTTRSEKSVQQNGATLRLTDGSRSTMYGRWELDWWSGARVETGDQLPSTQPHFRITANQVEVLDDHNQVAWTQPVPLAGVSAGAVSADRQYAAIGQTNGLIRVWKIGPAKDGTASASQELGVIRGYREEPLALAFSPLPPGMREAHPNAEPVVVLQTVTSDFVHRAWVIGAPPDVDEVRNAHRDTVRFFARHPSGRYIASGGYDGYVKVWDLEKGIAAGPVSSFEAQTGTSFGVAQLLFDKGGERLFTGGFDGSVREWDWRDGHLRREWHLPEKWLDLRPNIALSDDERKLYVSHHENCDRIDLDSGKVEATFGGGRVNIMSMLLLEREGVLIFGFPIEDRTNDRHLCEVWDIRSGKRLRTLDGHNAGVRCITASPARDRIATSSSDGTAIIWDWRSGQLLHRLDVHQGLAHTNDVPTVRFSPDPASDLLLTASHDYRVVLWSGQSGRALAEVRVDEEGDVPYGSTGALKEADFTLDGRKIFFGVKNDLRLLDLHYYDQVLAASGRAATAR